jgi:hypothetical protein
MTEPTLDIAFEIGDESVFPSSPVSTITSPLSLPLSSGQGSKGRVSPLLHEKLVPVDIFDSSLTRINVDYYKHCVESCVDQLPFLREFMSSDEGRPYDDMRYIFGGFLRWLVETNGKGDFKDYVKNGGDIDIVCYTKSVYDFTQLVKQVVTNKGYIEYFGNGYCGENNGEENNGEDDGENNNEDDGEKKITLHFDKYAKGYHTSELPLGNYGLYVPYNDGWLKYDVSLEHAPASYKKSHKARTLDFTVNGLTYPILDNERFALAICDIHRKRMQPHCVAFSPKYMLRVKKLWNKGYRFDSETTCALLYAYVQNQNESNASFYNTDTSVPSITDGNHYLIRTTQHKKEKATWERVMSDETISKLCDFNLLEPFSIIRKVADRSIVKDVFSDHGLYEAMHSGEMAVSIAEGSVVSVLEEDLVVYKKAILVQEKAVDQNTLFSRREGKGVVVCLKIAKGTKYHCGSPVEEMKIRFERAYVDSILAYPNVKMNLDELTLNGSMVKVVSLYDHSFTYTPGTTVTPSLPFDTNPHVCSNGIHAFMNLAMAWRYEDGMRAMCIGLSVESDVEKISGSNAKFATELKTDPTAGFCFYATNRGTSISTWAPKSNKSSSKNKIKSPKKSPKKSPQKTSSKTLFSNTFAVLSPKKI